MSMKFPQQIQKPLATIAFAAAAASTPACATVRQDVCYPASTLAYDPYGRPVAVPMTDVYGRPVMNCHTVYHIVPK
jgi:hypothetical protein